MFAKKSKTVCSILGYFNTKLSFSEIQNLNKKLSHRGPDNSTIREFRFKDKNLFLAHNRLSIQDLSKQANQPMESEKFIIVFNGEIYNHLEIRNRLNFKAFKTHSDTETLLYAFNEFGIKQTLDKLIGMFAIALFDKINQKLYLIRDRVGIKPLYYTLQNGEFAFASELKGFNSHLKNNINNRALIQFVSLSYIPNSSSYYRNIHKLEPAHYLVFDGKNIEKKRYWNLPKSKIDISFDDALLKTEKLIKSSIKYRLVSDIEVGSFLSGGVDSSLVSSIMQSMSTNKIKTFSIGFENSAYDESIYAKEVAKYIGSEHYEYKFSSNDVLNLLDSFDNYFDEPFGDASSLPMMLLSQITKDKVSVALSGDGGDELFLGYDRYFFTQNYYKKLNKTPKLIGYITSIIFKYSKIDKLEKMSYPIKNLNHLNLYSVLNTAIKPWELNNIFDSEFIFDSFGKDRISFLDLQDIELNSFENLEDFSRLDFLRYIPDDILTKVDRASMAYSLEARVPLLDHRLVEFAYQIPSDIKLKNGAKSILKEILYKYVPKELIDRPKRGFSVPLKHWFRDELKDTLFDKIDSLDEKFNKNYIKKLANLHIYHNRNYEYILWNLMRV